MKVVDIAYELYMEIGEPDDTSIPAVAFWVRANIGALNNYLFSDFQINSSFEVVDGSGNEIDINAVAILKKMFIVYRYAVIIRSKITDTDTKDVIIVQDQDTSVRRIDKNQLIKTISAEKKQEEEMLKNLISAYRGKQSSPKHVVGDDIVGGIFPSNYPYAPIGRNYGYTAF
jgi:hypothetical protein